MVRKKIIDENLLNKKRHTLFTAERYCHIIEQQSGLHSFTKLYINNQHPVSVNDKLYFNKFQYRELSKSNTLWDKQLCRKKNEFEIFELI